MTSSALALFARYPEVGKCKTRLSAAIGAEAAADLHCQMLAHTLGWTEQLARSSGVDLQLHICGSDPLAFQRMLRQTLKLPASSIDAFRIVPQVNGDLGCKIQACVRQLRAAGYERALIVGTDCPQLDANRGLQALQSLSDHHVCFAPAADGGYVLVALELKSVCSKAIDRIFEDISWGTEKVMMQSLAALEGSDLQVRLLTTLQDVDRPEDLQVWEQRRSFAKKIPGLSVIIPVYGAEPQLEAVVARAQRAADVEVIIAAAGANHQNLTVAGRRHTQFMCCEPGRARQMNEAVEISRGERLLFLHADTLLPDDYRTAIDRILDDPQVIAGAFRLRIDSCSRAARWIERGVHLRSARLSMPYGDQGIFMRRSDFERSGGFENLPIMEDYEFIRRLRRRGIVKTASLSVTTSPRRWEQLGFLRTTFINQLMIAGFHLGISPEKLARLYRRNRCRV